MSSNYFPLSFPVASSATEVVVTPEEFHAFHTIDRILYNRLVFGLNRDRNQSFEVFSFLLMLEQFGNAPKIIKYLISLSDSFIDSVANEVVVCLSFLHNQAYSTTFFAANTNDDHNSFIPLLVQLTGGKLTLRFIHENREKFLEGIAKNVTNICHRAFDDIWARAETYDEEKFLALEREKAIDEMQKLRLTTTEQGSSSRLSVQQATTIRPNVQEETTYRPVARQETTYRPVFRKDTIAPPLPVEEEEAKEQALKLATDDRTVFLMFAKGYPISEDEVRVYFTREFGDVIEAVLMQNVEYEQPLFAKMVLKKSCASKMEEIVSARIRNKFTINGKHVWARINVPKNAASSSSSAQI